MTYKLNMQALKAVKDRLDNGRGGNEINWLKIHAGDNYFHILPPWEGSELPFHEVYLHFLKDENGTNHVFQCAKRFEGRCVLCERAKALEESGNEEDKKLANQFKWKHRYMYNAVDSKMEVGVLSVTPTCHRDIIDELYYDVESNLDPFAYKGGLLMCIKRTGSSWNNTEYKARGQRNRIDMPDGMESRHSQLLKLNTIYDVYTNAELTQVLSGNFDPKGVKTKPKKEGEATAQKTEAVQASPLQTAVQTVAATVSPAPAVTNVQPEVKPVQQQPVINNQPNIDEALKLLDL